MSEFKIKPTRTKAVISNMKQLESLLNRYRTELDQCLPGIYFSINSPEVRAAIRTLSNDIRVEKTKMAELSSALEKVVFLYESTESQILNTEGKTDVQKSAEKADTEKKGAIEKTLEILEEIIGHDAMSFISCLVEELLKLSNLGDGVDITAGILDTLNYMIDDLQDGATINSLYANLIVSAMATILAMGAGKAIEGVITGVITSACAGATGGFGAAIAPFAAIIGKLAGAATSVVTGHVVDIFNEADWDRDGESNRTEIKNAIEFVLDWKYPHGDDYTFYLPEGI